MGQTTKKFKKKTILERITQLFHAVNILHTRVTQLEIIIAEAAKLGGAPSEEKTESGIIGPKGVLEKVSK